jgi:large subunit ribosomal protein L30
MSQKMHEKILVKQIASPLGKNKIQRATLIGLGLNKMNRTRVLENTQSVMGMVNKVAHLVNYTKITAAE